MSVACRLSDVANRASVDIEYAPDAELVVEAVANVPIDGRCSHRERRWRGKRR